VLAPGLYMCWSATLLALCMADASWPARQLGLHLYASTPPRTYQAKLCECPWELRFTLRSDDLQLRTHQACKPGEMRSCKGWKGQGMGAGAQKGDAACDVAQRVSPETLG